MSALLDALRRPSITNEPPTAKEQWRNDMAVLLVALVALLLGWSIRNAVVDARSQFSLGPDLPALEYPRSWLQQGKEGLIFQAIDPASASTFDARLSVAVQEGVEEQALEMAEMTWPLQRSKEFQWFRHLSTRPVTGPDDRPALLVEYAYVADPTRASGGNGLPVVVRAQDLLFLASEGPDARLVAVTVAADAGEWDEHADQFQAIFQSLGVKEGAQ